MKVYLFRGLFGGLFSTGINTLAEKLSAQGHETSVHKWSERNIVEQKIISENLNSISPNLALVGHSLGGNAASYLTEELFSAGIKVNYLATLDATAPKPVPQGIIADNFRSSDWRDKPVAGANEFEYPELTHTEIDKDDSIHQKILDRINTFNQNEIAKPDTFSIGGITMSEDSTRGGGAGQAYTNLTHNSRDLSSVITALIAILNNSTHSKIETSDPAVVAQTTPEMSDKKDKLTPVNGWLGKWIGNLLNGKKTGLGIVGLLAVYLLPTLFPQLAPIQAIFQALGATSDQLVKPFDDAGNPIETGKNILTPIFAALGGWGILGKIEKWVEKKRG